MNIVTVARTIQLIVAPVVMVTSCALVLNGLLQRYGAINDRLRDMARERFDLLRTGGGDLASFTPKDPFVAERLQQIDTQMPLLLRRHKQIHDAVLTVYSAILVLVLCMFVIALAAILNAPWIALAALIIFLAGTSILLLGLLITMNEVRASHTAVEYEAQRVLYLGK